MNQEDIYFRAGGKITHCGVEMLPSGKDVEVVIARIEYKDSEMVNGRQENGIWLAHFAPNPYTTLPLILNSTNKKRLVKLFPSCEGYLARLKNVPVRMTKELTRDPQGGGQVYGLRISMIPAKPQAAPAKKTITEDKVSAVIEWAIANDKTMDDIAALFVFSKEIGEMIENAITVTDDDEGTNMEE